MKTLCLLLICGLIAGGQTTPGIVTVGTTVTATSGSGATAVSCVFSNPARPTIHTVCSVAGVAALTQDATPAVGSTNGVVGTFVNAGNTVTWVIQQPAAGSVTWQIAANLTSQSGTF